MKRLTLFIIGFLFLANFALAETRIYFSPNGGVEDAIVKELDKAQNSVVIAMYSFTSRPIAQELDKIKAKNVKIRIVLDKDQETQKYSKSRYFIQRGYEVKYDTGAGLMHNKFAVIDGKVLITGSFNWTAGAEHKNEENLLILDDPTLVQKYAERFEYLWQKGRKGTF